MIVTRIHCDQNHKKVDLDPDLEERIWKGVALGEVLDEAGAMKRSTLKRNQQPHRDQIWGDQEHHPGPQFVKELVRNRCLFRLQDRHQGLLIGVGHGPRWRLKWQSPMKTSCGWFVRASDGSVNHRQWSNTSPTRLLKAHIQMRLDWRQSTLTVCGMTPGQRWIESRSYAMTNLLRLIQDLHHARSLLKELCHLKGVGLRMYLVHRNHLRIQVPREGWLMRVGWNRYLQRLWSCYPLSPFKEHATRSWSVIIGMISLVQLVNRLGKSFCKTTKRQLAITSIKFRTLTHWSLSWSPIGIQMIFWLIRLRWLEWISHR